MNVAQRERVTGVLIFSSNGQGSRLWLWSVGYR